MNGLWSWLQRPLQVLWSWPRRPRRIGPPPGADVRVIRRTTPDGLDLELWNTGAGPADDVSVRLRAGPERAAIAVAAIPVLGPGTTYIVTLQAVGEEAGAPPIALHVGWRNLDGVEGESCWELNADRRTFRRVACPGAEAARAPAGA